MLPPSLTVGPDHEDAKEYFAWPHLRLRNKPFPWGDGDTSLFHNSHTNPGPEKEASQSKGSFRVCNTLIIRFFL